MFNHKPSTSQLEKKYRNVEEEGRGTMRYYRNGSKRATRKGLYAILFLIAIVMVMVLVFAIIGHHGYLQQWKIVVKYIFSFHPGHINNTETDT